MGRKPNAEIQEACCVIMMLILLQRLLSDAGQGTAPRLGVQALDGYREQGACARALPLAAGNL